MGADIGGVNIAQRVSGKHWHAAALSCQFGAGGGSPTRSAVIWHIRAGIASERLSKKGWLQRARWVAQLHRHRLPPDAEATGE